MIGSAAAGRRAPVLPRQRLLLMPLHQVPVHPPTGIKIAQRGLLHQLAISTVLQRACIFPGLLGATSMPGWILREQVGDGVSEAFA